MLKETIRWIDVELGTAICFFLTLVRRCVDLVSGERRGQAAVSKILFLKLIEQGATVLAAAAINNAVRRVGRENVYFCVFAENRPIVDILGLIPAENVIELRHSGLMIFAFDTLRALRRLRRARVDAVIDMEFMTRAPAILSYLTGAASRVGLHRFTSEAPYRGDLMTHRVQYNPYLHTSEAYNLLVDALDEDPRDLPLLKVSTQESEVPPHRLVVTNDDASRVWGLLEHEGLASFAGPLVVLNPNTGDLLPLRTWPRDRFVELGQRILANHPGVTLVVTGAESERQETEKVCERIGSERVICVAGKTTLRDVMVLYSIADVLVTNDSGPGHFASMTGIDNIVLFGPESPQRFGPLGERSHAIWARLACSPCVTPYNHRFSPCTDNRCMQVIEVDEVYQRVVASLASRRLRGGEAEVRGTG